MANINFTADIKFDNDYEQARYDLAKAEYSFSKLSQAQKEALIREMIGAEALVDFINLIQQYRGNQQ